MRRVRNYSSEPRVLVEELVEVCGLPPGGAFTKLASLGITVSGDWAGRPSISVGDAAMAFSKIIGDLQDHAEHWQSYQAYVERRAEQLKAARIQAAEAARKAATGRGTPQQEAKAAAAATQAQERFEAQHPLLAFEEYREGADSV